MQLKFVELKIFSTLKSIKHSSTTEIYNYELIIRCQTTLRAATENDSKLSSQH